MKRSSLTLSVFGVAVFGCLAFSSTASAVASGTWGPDPCAIDYDYCVAVSGNSEAYCEAQYIECEQQGDGFSQKHQQAIDNLPTSDPEAGPRVD